MAVAVAHCGRGTLWQCFTMAGAHCGSEETREVDLTTQDAVRLGNMSLRNPVVHTHKSGATWKSLDFWTKIKTLYQVSSTCPELELLDQGIPDACV